MSYFRRHRSFRIVEQSGHTWFVLKYLLGYPDVRIYLGRDQATG